MSETTAEPTATDAPAENDKTEQKPTETVEFWKQKAREQEKRAKENSKAADRLAEIENANKSEAEKAAARIAELEADAASARLEALRFKVASEYADIDAATAELLLTGSDEETMRAQAEAFAAGQDKRKKQGNQVPREGTNPQPSGDEMRDFTVKLFEAAD